MRIFQYPRVSIGQKDLPPSPNPLTSVMRSAVLYLTTGIDATADFESPFRFFCLPPIAPQISNALRIVSFQWPSGTCPNR
jgi:hypothetical protein